MQVAINAGEREVVEVILTAMNFRDDVFKMKCSQRRVILVQVAILTSIASAFADFRLLSQLHRFRIETLSVVAPDVEGWRQSCSPVHSRRTPRARPQ